jgi:hypothetical protein
MSACLLTNWRASTHLSPISLSQLIGRLRSEKFSMNISSDAAQGDDHPPAGLGLKKGKK